MSTPAEIMLQRLRQEQELQPIGAPPPPVQAAPLTEAERLLQGFRQGQPAPAIQPQQPAPDTGITARQVVQQGAKGLLLGFSDELTAAFGASIAAVADGVPFSEAFKDILEAERTEVAQFEEQHPVLSTALQIGGGIATGGVGATRAAGAKVFQGATTRLGQAAQRTGSMAATGVPAGAVFGAGVTEGGIGERAVGAAEGAALGAAGGVVLRPVVAATTAIARTPIRAVRGAIRSLMNTEARQADVQIARSLRDLGDDPIDIARQRLQEGGDDLALFDVGSEAAALELERVASRPGVGRNKVVQEITSRLDDQPTQLTDEVRQIFMPQTQLEVAGQRTGVIVKTFKDVSEEITAKASAEAAPLYAQAYKAPVNNSAGPLKALLKNSRINKAMKQAVQDIKDETIDAADPNAPILRRLQNEANADNPNLMVWDRTKRVLDDLQNAQFVQGNATRARAIKKNLASLRDTLDKQVPVYGRARKIWAGGQEAADAHLRGSQVLDALDDLPGNTTADDLIGMFDDLSDAGKQLYRTGVGQKLENIIGTTPDEGTQAVALVSRIMGSPDKRKVMSKAIPDAKQRNNFFKSLRAEKDFSKRANEVLSKSRSRLRSFLRGEEQGKIRTIVSNLVAGQFALSGNQFAQLRLATSALSGQRSALPGVNRRVAERLLETRGAELRKALDDIDRVIGIPKSLQDVKGKSGAQLVRFFLDNPEARRNFNEVIAGVSAAILTSPENRRNLQAIGGLDNEQ